ncbi:MAG: ComEC/Rec2 family competence protein [Candidatus Parcubacteria bacterium]|nr:ComEC/Rec2 family competence protein [Candidatus Parcubacteria bacterium]
MFDFFIVYLLFLSAIIAFIVIPKNKLFLILGIWAICFAAGIWRYQVSEPENTADKIYFYNSQNIEFSGLVSKEPDVREAAAKYEIKTAEIFLNSKWQPVSGKVLISTEIFPEYRYGDLLKIKCKLKKPEAIEDFKYDRYLARYDIYSLCYNPQIEKLASGQGNLFLTLIYRGKNFFISRINSILPEPQASFLGGLLIGAKKSIPSNLQEVFNKTGTTHIVAVSGYNVTIIAACLLLLAQTIGIARKKSFWLIISLLFIFVIITGAQASIIRAAVMGAIVLLANYLGRKSKVTNALALAAAIMLMQNPRILLADMGFQLSFLATLGLVYISPILNQLAQVDKIKNKFSKALLSDYLLTTFSAIIITQPLIFYQFGKLALVAPIANILVLPFIPLAMLLGFIAGIVTLILPGLGWAISWLVWLVLSYIIFVLEKLASLNWAYWEMPKISLGLMIGLYAFILGFIWYFRKYKNGVAQKGKVQ